MKAILFSHELDLLSIILNGDSEVEIKLLKVKMSLLHSLIIFLPQSNPL